MNKKILMVFGTRPEAIKMLPLAKKLKECGHFATSVCLTAQHRQMLDSVMNVFDVKADYDLNIMTPDQSLPLLTSSLMTELSKIYEIESPNLVLVQGDTTTTFIAALAAFYKKIPVGHVEAGLRTGDLLAPWPEEANRQLTTRLTQFHFTPTETARSNLIKENISEDRIFVTGNTVIDALLMTRDRIESSLSLQEELQSNIGITFKTENIILVTGHRRENFGEKFRCVFQALKEIAQRQPDVEIVFPVHLNPAVRGPVYQMLTDVNNIHLIEPLDYQSFVYLMNRCRMIITDSGGVQEEAPSLGKPVLVTRDVTERPEAVDAGTVKLVGTNTNLIVESTLKILNDESEYQKMAKAINPYGDGKACDRIQTILLSNIENFSL